MIAPAAPHPLARAKPRIVILGGGFAGAYTALHLHRLSPHAADASVTLLSRDNYFLMTPLLFEAASGILEPRHAVTPLRSLLPHTQYIEADIEHIDLSRRVIIGRHAAAAPDFEIPFDHLVFALGGVTNRRLIPGSEHAMAFKTLADAIFARNHIIDLFEQAVVELDPQRRSELLTFIVIGGGLVGVELMGELTAFVSNLLHTYTQIPRQAVHFHLIEAGPHLLPEMQRGLADYATQTLRDRGVHIRLSTPAQRIEPHTLYLPPDTPDAPDQILRAHTIVLAAGVTANPLLAELPLPKDKHGRLLTEPTMQIKDHPHLWALGDCAAIPDPSGKPYPMLAQHALREAKTLAHNLLESLRHPASPSLRPFVYQSLGTLAALGHYSGVGRIMSFNVRGFLAWWVWRTYYMLQLPRLDRKLRVILDWTIALFFKNDIVKLDLFGMQHPAERTAAYRQAEHLEPSAPTSRLPEERPVTPP